MHWEVVAQVDELVLELVVVATELELGVFTLELVLVATDVATELLVEVAGAELVVATELIVATELLVVATLVATELLVVVVEQTAPVIAGFSAAEPFLSPCTPKLTDWPG